MREQDYLRWVRRQLTRHPRVLVDSGDDAAVLRLNRGSVLFKTDGVVEGVHFTPGTSPEKIGRKAMARALSDIAAMGCWPVFAVVGVVFRHGAPDRFAKRLFQGLKSMAERFQCRIVGGDISAHAGPLTVTVSLLGESRGLKPILRSGARPGHSIVVTGSLGGSILGKHLNFIPRVRESLEINRRYRVHAMIDVSDGLAVDLWHLCEAGKVGAEIFEWAIPISKEARRLARTDERSPLEHALQDGEDYELLMACPEGEARKIVRRFKATILGRFLREPILRLKTKDGHVRRIHPKGWDYDLDL